MFNFFKDTYSDDVQSFWYGNKKEVALSFSSCQTVSDVKKLYRELARKNHPDIGGSTTMMQRINDEYKKAMKMLKTTVNNTGSTAKAFWDGF